MMMMTGVAQNSPPPSGPDICCPLMMRRFWSSLNLGLRNAMTETLARRHSHPPQSGHAPEIARVPHLHPTLNLNPRGRSRTRAALDSVAAMIRKVLTRRHLVTVTEGMSKMTAAISNPALAVWLLGTEPRCHPKEMVLHQRPGPPAPLPNPGAGVNINSHLEMDFETRPRPAPGMTTVRIRHLSHQRVPPKAGDAMVIAGR